ncbi:MAG: hypothetical protein GF388_05750 [Candidatus Aegiribacteria sp.]|nr:hypothetical protein [Candidatus Aegiribacteria sp.]
MDILYINDTSCIVSDDFFSVVEGSDLPQMAVSRIAVTNRSDVQIVAERSLAYRSGENSGEWQTRVLGAADDERHPDYPSSDERYHTQSMERMLTDHLPDVLMPVKMYMILYDWTVGWQKPEAREDYIEMWKDGYLITIFMGHGSYDQLADEGLFFLSDVNLLDCDSRLPLAFYGSCDVGLFQDPSTTCIGQQLVVTPSGGAILGLAATHLTSGTMNETFFSAVLDNLFANQGLSVGMCTLLGKIDVGYSTNQMQYELFGDGSLELAFPWNSFSVNSDTLYSGEINSIEGTAPGQGLVMIEAYESCVQDTYYTHNQSLPIEYLSMPGRYYSGAVSAGSDFLVNMFIPLDSDTGGMARTQLIFTDSDQLAAATTYRQWLRRGDPLPDTEGPEVELWLDGYRNKEDPSVSGELTVRAVLSDTSGINLLGNVGRQLALYVDDVPRNVSDYFQYNQGSSTTGELTVEIGTLDPGSHELRLRASDGLLNVTETQMTFNVTEDNVFEISSVFAYPNPCDEGTSVNWVQTTPGKIDISIYTVAGRRISEFRNIEGEPGYNQCWWNCRDADGDPVASGSYIFIISAASAESSGEGSEATGVIAVVRN